jgi:hypothetical protein
MALKGNLLALLVTLTCATAGQVDAQTFAAESAVCKFYVVRIWGEADTGLGPQSFDTATQWNQFLVLRSPGTGTNQVEILFTNFPRSVIGDTRGNLSSGAFPVGHIELMTNSLYANNAGIRSHHVDLAEVSVSTYWNPEDVVEFQLIPQAALNVPQPNAVVMPGQGSFLGGLAFLPNGVELFNSLPNANLLDTEFLVPYRGGGYLFFPDTDRSVVYGQIQLAAVSHDFNFNLTGFYNGTFYGEYLGSLQCQ